MATKLGLYNGALLEIGERRLASLSENRAPRYALDETWDGTLRLVLEEGLWNFAMRSQEIAYSTSVTPDFGYTYAFAQPSDMVRLAALCSDATMRLTIDQYVDEAGYWWANVDTIYASFVSDDTGYGADLSRWPATFEKYVTLELASAVCVRITGSEAKLDRIEKMKKRALMNARSKDAMSSANRRVQKSNWLEARLQGSRINGTGRGL